MSFHNQPDSVIVEAMAGMSNGRPSAINRMLYAALQDANYHGLNRAIGGSRLSNHSAFEVYDPDTQPDESDPLVAMIANRHTSMWNCKADILDTLGIMVSQSQNWNGGKIVALFEQAYRMIECSEDAVLLARLYSELD